MSAPRLPGPCQAISHGRESDYNSRGCRCPEARALANSSRLRRKHRLKNAGPGYIAAHGAARRLQALACMGWDCVQIGEYIGSDHNHVSQVRRMQRDIVTKRMHDVVVLTYKNLATVRGPSKRAVADAARNGWAAPVDWWGLDIDDPNTQPGDIEPYVSSDDYVDEVAVERVIAGDTSITLTRPEKLAAAEILLRRGVPKRHIIELLHISARDFKTAAA